jgi:uncharacterized protein
VTLRSTALGAYLKAGRPRTRQVACRPGLRVPAPDGAALLTDLYLSDAGAPGPTILIRSPYGRREPFATISRLFAERGYHVVFQSTRGTFGSGGAIDFDAEAADGRAAADWITGQPWSNGDIGGYGASYLSFTQLALASTKPPQLKAMALGVWTAQRRAAYYPGGSFSLDRALSWTFTVNRQERSRMAMLGGARELQPALMHLPLLEADTVVAGQPVPFYRDWLTHDQPGDPYWEPTDFRALLPGLGIPVTVIAGWYDIFLPYMVEDFAALAAGGQRARLRIGAWRHSSAGLIAAAFRDALEWFGVHLRHEPPRSDWVVRAEVMGGGGWRDLAGWPPPAQAQQWYLQPGGKLATAPPPDSGPDRYRYDPADPTPAVGGSSLSMNSGPKDNRELERRPDVLTYTSDPLGAPLEILGPVTASLHAASSLGHTDFFARLCDVSPRGRSVNITDGLVRRVPGDPPVVSIGLWPTGHRFARGHRIRLQVSSGSHPRYARNLGSGEPLATGTTLRAADQEIYHDPRRPSAVTLPVISVGPRTPDDG